MKPAGNLKWWRKARIAMTFKLGKTDRGLKDDQRFERRVKQLMVRISLQTLNVVKVTKRLAGIAGDTGNKLR